MAYLPLTEMRKTILMFCYLIVNVIRETVYCKKCSCVDRWTKQNRRIVRFTRTDRSGDEFNGRLLIKYKEPSIDEITMQQIDQSKTNRHNYTHRMHSLIGLEEMAQAKAIATESRSDSALSLLQTISLVNVHVCMACMHI